jgi:hypothetical protein
MRVGVDRRMNLMAVDRVGGAGRIALIDVGVRLIDDISEGITVATISDGDAGVDRLEVD